MIVRTIGAEDEAISYGGYPDGYWYVAYQKDLLKGVWYQQGQGMSRSAVAVLLYNYYTADPGIAGNSHVHNWETVHFNEIGHYENSGTHRVKFNRCTCGFTVNSDMANAGEIWETHKLQCSRAGSSFWYEEVPNGEANYVVDVPAYDRVRCSICGITQ